MNTNSMRKAQFFTEKLNEKKITFSHTNCFKVSSHHTLRNLYSLLFTCKFVVRFLGKDCKEILKS